MQLLLLLLKPVPSATAIMNIDGVDIQRIDRTSLRQRIIAIPQDVAFLLTGTRAKQNLDPFGEATDEECVLFSSRFNYPTTSSLVGGLGGIWTPSNSVWVSDIFLSCPDFA